MGRKVAKIGSSTLMVSLPSKWCKANNVKKGDEVEIIEEGKEIVIRIGKTIKLEEITLDTKNIPNILYRVVGALYKAGYDKIKFIYDSPEALSIIQKQLGRSLIGFDVVEETKNTIVLKKLSELETKEFDTVLKRCFFTLFDMAEESIDSIRKKDLDRMKKVVLRDDSINKGADLCRRILNKGDYAEARPSPVYFIVEQLEKIGDIYKDLCKFVLENPLGLSRQTDKIYGKVNAFLRDFYESYYKFDLPAMEKFIQKKREISAVIEKSWPKTPKKELKIMFYLNHLVECIFDMNGPLMTSRV